MAIWRQLAILVVLAGLGYGGFLAWSEYFGGAEATASGPARGARTASVEVAAAERRILRRTVEAVGTARARQSVEIRPLAAGRIVELAVSPGVRVGAGDVLARLDDEIERADYAEAEAMVLERRQSADRAQRLLKTNAVAESAVDQAVATLAVAEADLERARRRLEDRTIRAPFAGQVGLSEVDLGARVDAATMLTRLDDLSSVEIEFSLPETLFAEIRPGMAVSAEAAAFPSRVFTGEVFAIDSRVDPVSRAFRVRATIPNPKGELPAGMFMSLSLTISEEEALVTPEEAVVAQAGATYVFVVSDEKAERRKVTTGLRTEGVIAIREGLSDGEIVVIRGLAAVRDGGAVKIVGGPAPDGAPKS